jgi:hypothetical protein
MTGSFTFAAWVNMAQVNRGAGYNVFMSYGTSVTNEGLQLVEDGG